MNKYDGHYIALCGGVGGAKLAWSLAQLLTPGQLTVVVNTGDDFEHLGLPISPDLDTVMYTLAGIANKTQGWGIEGETWHCLHALETLGGDTWFKLGDRDIATHIRRRSLLQRSHTLSDTTQQLCSALGITHTVVPMSDQRVSTFVHTDEGTLVFQDYFVRHQCKPRIEKIEFVSPEPATLSPAFSAALTDPALRGIIICPSNPYLSIDPILAIPGVREQLAAVREKVLAVSPLIGGNAIKGPTAKLMEEMGIALDNTSIADHYRAIAGTLLIDTQDQEDIHAIQDYGVHAIHGHILMNSDERKRAVASLALNYFTQQH